MEAMDNKMPFPHVKNKSECARKYHIPTFEIASLSSEFLSYSVVAITRLSCMSTSTSSNCSKQIWYYFLLLAVICNTIRGNQIL
jgi:hypothetical protein